ncbi:hypothetical protein ACOSP7_019307 [Xanthoceras sorbifolium]
METMNNPSPKFGEWLCASVPGKPNARFQFGATSGGVSGGDGLMIVQREALETQAGSLLLKNDEVDMGTKMGSTSEEYLGNEEGGEGIWLELVMKVGLANSMKDSVLKIGPNSLNGAAEDFNLGEEVNMAVNPLPEDLLASSSLCQFLLKLVAKEKVMNSWLLAGKPSDSDLEAASSYQPLATKMQQANSNKKKK